MEENRTFHVCTILPMPNKINKDEESDWTPRFPGLVTQKIVENGTQDSNQA